MSLFSGLFSKSITIGNGTGNIVSTGNANITSIKGTTYFNGINLNERLGIKNINSITSSNGKIIIDGKDYTKELLSNGYYYGDISIEIKGSCGNINTTGTVKVEGNSGAIDTNGTVSVGGDVNGDIDTNGAVTVNGSVKGDIDTNGRVIVGRR